MIFFVAPAEGTSGMGEYLQQEGGRLLARIRILTYEEIAVRKQLPLGTYVFSAIDQLSPTETEIAAQCWQELAGASSEITLINHPTEVVSRYDLLKSCFELKRNSFRVRRASEFVHRQNFPVFLRRELDHWGSITGLLYTPRQLVQALTKALLLGYRLRDMLIVQYCETRDPSGIFRKYSAHSVGDRIIPHTLVHSRNWVTKAGGRVVDAAKAREELEYVRSDPHAEWLRETFELAKVRYGRIDYGVKDGVPQVWEINTNPTIAPRVGHASAMTEEQRKLRAPVRERFFAQFEAAWEAIDSAVDPRQAIRIEVSREQSQNLEAERRLRSRLQAGKTALSQVAYVPIWLFRRLRPN